MMSLCLGVLLVTGASVIGAAGTPSRALAFTNPTDYGKYPDESPGSKGFGAGRYFTGSPADGYSCEVCHSASPANYSFPLAHKGLPLDGYVPGEAYKIELSWPEATASYMAAQARGLNPVTTLLAEFVAQDGGPAGSVSFASEAERNSIAFPNLYCETLAMATSADEGDDAYGMNIYVQDTGSLPLELTVRPTTKAARAFNGRCTVERGKDEEGREYDRRCIVAMKPCGAQRVKLVWTAPDEWSGPIWFSAGFVTTYNRTAKPNDEDFVTTLSIPLNPGYEGSEHVTVVESGCSVGHGPRSSGKTPHGFAFALAIAGLVFGRRKRRALGLVLAALLIVLGTIGCNEGSGLVTNAVDPVGAYESTVKCTRACDLPIECRKSAWPDAGTPESAAEARDRMRMGEEAPAPAPAAAGTGAAGSGAGVRSLGSITAQFTTSQPDGYVSDWISTCPDGVLMCSPHYVVAWIENEAGEYVQTVRGSQGQFVGLSAIRYSRLGSDCQDPKEPTIDAMASATLFVHQVHSVTWDGLYGSGHKAAVPGVYRLRIEVPIDETHHFDLADVRFTFGDPAPSTLMFPPEPAHTGVTLTYTPTPP